MSNKHRRHFDDPDELEKVRGYQRKGWEYVQFWHRDYPGRRILDVGASEGYLGTLVKKSDYVGIDIDPASPEVLPYDLDGFMIDYPDEKFDLVVYNHVLEHTEHPLMELKRSYQILNQWGLIFIAVPNGNRPWAYEYDGHLYAFYAPTLSRLLKLAGFSIVDVSLHCFREDKEELWIVAQKLP